ncbi:MAG: cobalamin B12-binding domain-containing protein [Candidatus Eisenbacteria bacterium]|nr:cobalamin B12-binding domain-containing protein [Candidatus Eisenbacteria bacterium]
MQRKIRVLVGKPGLDGHDRGAKVVAAALRDAGMEVIYTGLHQTPVQIVEAAVQEDVDVVALSVLSGAHMTLFPGILALMREHGIGDRLLTGGGIIPNDDMHALLAQGIGRLFGPGTNTQDIVHYIREWYAGVHGADALPPLPPPPARPAPMAPAAGSLQPTRAEARHHAPKASAPVKKAAAKKAAPKKAAKKVAKKAAKKAAPKKAASKKAAPKKAAKKAAKKPVKKSPAKKKPAPKKKSRR